MVMEGYKNRREGALKGKGIEVKGRMGRNGKEKRDERQGCMGWG